MVSVSSMGATPAPEPKDSSKPQETNKQQDTNSCWTKYDNAGGQANVQGDGIIQEEELNNFINDKSNELGMNLGDANKRVGAEFKRLAGSLIGQSWQNCFAALENMARHAVNNVRGQIAAETGQEPTQVPMSLGTTENIADYDRGIDGTEVPDGVISKEELLNFANTMSDKLGMNRGDVNKQVVEKFIQMAGAHVGERWQNSIGTLDELIRVAVNDVRGQIAAETGQEPTQVPRGGGFGV